MADMEQYPQEWRQYEPIQPQGSDWRGFFRKLWAPIAAIGAFLAKFGVVLLKFKFLFSMFVSAAVYVWIGGWWFGIGLVVLALRPRDGTRARGEAAGAAGVGAALHPVHGRADHAQGDAAQRLARGEARDRRPAARLGRRAGDLSSSASPTTRNSLKALAFLGFFINLFNLLPVVPLDGGRITAALHPALWLVGFVGLLGLVIWKPNPILIIILLFSASELWRRWQMRDHPEMQEYYRVKPHQRLIDRRPLLRPRGPARARHARDTRASKLLMEDRRILSAEEKTEDLEQDIALIAQEFREGFQAVDKIDQPGGDDLRLGADPREDTRLYEEARATGRRFAELGWAVVTGGGPGVMEAANRGAKEGGGLSVGFNIELPHEQPPNPYLDISLHVPPLLRAQDDAS